MEKEDLSHIIIMGHGQGTNSRWRKHPTTRRADGFLASLGYLQGDPTLQPADEKAVLRLDMARGGRD